MVRTRPNTARTTAAPPNTSSIPPSLPPLTRSPPPFLLAVFEDPHARGQMPVPDERPAGAGDGGVGMREKRAVPSRPLDIAA